MRINKLIIENFRNYLHLDFDFPNEKIVVFQGDNAQGKTNIVEAIYTNALTKSFSRATKEEILTWNTEYGRSITHSNEGEDTQKLEVFWGKTNQYPKTLKINDIKRKSEDYIGNVLVVLFTPQDINLIPLSPAERRKYLNILLSQTDKKYIKNLIAYQNTLKNRNALLKKIFLREANKEELTYWTEKLIEQGSYIYCKRRELVKELNKKLSKYYSLIAGEQTPARIVWSKEMPEKPHETEEWYKNRLKEKEERDIAAQRTLSGPHRDDYVFFCKEKNIVNHGSRGEWRTMILSIKLAEIDYIKERTGKTPILLLDDVLSEFDENRQINILNLFHADQIIITTTHIPKINTKMAIYQVISGTIKRKK